MIVEIEIVQTPIVLNDSLPPTLVGTVGATATFAGAVRGNEAGQPISALEYEAYQPMAEQTMRAIVADLGQRHACALVRIIHRIGTIPVGENAIYILTAAAHRAEALAMITAFMDRLKQDVPIWKTHALDTSGQPVPPSP